MRPIACRLAIFSLCAVGLLPASAAQAQWYANGASQPPLYPYELQPGQSYAVEVAPGTYVIHRPSNERAYRPVSRRVHQAAPKPVHTHANRALIEQLRRRDAQRTRRAAKRAAKLAAKRTAKKAAEKTAKQASHHADRYAGRKPDKIIHTKRIVREKPLVIETRRVVQDSPHVVTRRHYINDLPRRRGQTRSIASNRAGNEEPRVIHADAEITILGPDRMSIRLVRKDGQGLDADARPPKRKKRK